MLSLFVLVGNPLIVLVIMGLMGYSARVSFQAGLTVAQISEFSLILAALGLSLGHIDNATLSLITVVGLVTIGISTYLIVYSRPLYDRLAGFLSVFERADIRPEPPDTERETDVILYGLGRYGRGIARGLAESGVEVIAVDHDPRAAAAWDGPPITIVYGDAEDLDFLDSLPLRPSTWVISTLADPEVNLALLHALRSHGHPCHVALTAHRDEDAARMERADPDLILRPFRDAAEVIVADVLASGVGRR